jgi:hypothetical protein
MRFFKVLFLIIGLSLLLVACGSNDSGGDDSEIKIEWVDTNPTATFVYSGGILTAINFYKDFIVTGSSGDVQISATVKDTPGSSNVIDEQAASFYVEKGIQYKVTVRVKVAGRKMCSPSDTDVIIFSSPSVSSDKETPIYPDLGNDNNFYCLTTYQIDKITFN